MKRKNFLNTLLGFGGFGALFATFYPVFSYLVPPKSSELNTKLVKAGKASEFEANSGKIIKFGSEPVILIRKADKEFVAFTATCTHLDCIVQYRKDTKQIWCACHNGTYNLRGNNVSGPPPKPLTEYNVKIVKDEIVITPA